MELHYAIRNQNMEKFDSLISNGADITEIDSSGNTVLHTLASQVFSSDLINEVKLFFNPKARVSDWIFKISSALSNTKIKNMTDFSMIQNQQMNTCMHIAINNENWEFAEILEKNFLRYKIYPGRLLKNNYGLNEYELFLTTYGIKGRSNILESIFNGCSKSLIWNELKIAHKSYKIIKLQLENDESKDVFITPSHRLFHKANEETYPSPYATLPDRKDLNEIYKEFGLMNPTEKEYESEKYELRLCIESECDKYEGKNRDLYYLLLVDWVTYLKSTNCSHSSLINSIKDLQATYPSGFVYLELMKFKLSLFTKDIRYIELLNSLIKIRKPENAEHY